jgi:hypothetical protein
MHHPGGFTPRECEAVSSHHPETRMSESEIRDNTRMSHAHAGYPVGAGTLLTGKIPSEYLNIAEQHHLCLLYYTKQIRRAGARFRNRNRPVGPAGRCFLGRHSETQP